MLTDRIPYSAAAPGTRAAGKGVGMTERRSSGQAVAEPRTAPGSDAAWWRGAVVYQIYPRSFLDSDGDGTGDLAGIARKLDYVAGLGVDAIWVCPFFPSPMRDFGYDVADYCGVDPRFGTLGDFDALVRRAHGLGLRVMIDQVWSHSSDAHPWFQASRSGRDGAHADWYVWADPRPDGSPPNNWLSVFGGPAWHWEPRRRQYYLHHFLASQPQLDLRNPRVVDALFAAGRFWLDRGVDGFRLDAVDFMFHDPALRDNPPRELAGAAPMRPFGMQRHLHDMLHPDLMDFFVQVRGLMARYPGTATLAEVSSEPGALQRCAAYSDAFADRLDMAYTLDLMKRELTAASLRRVLAEAEGGGCVCWAFSNHDVVRATTRWGRGGNHAAFGRMLVALLLTLPGAACLYQGEELALDEAEIGPEDMVDPYGLAFYPAFKGRDGARTPMPWRSGLPAAGFTRAARPWLPIAASHRLLAVDRQERDPASVLNFVRRFAGWRAGEAALRRGTCRTLELPEPVFAVERRAGSEAVLALFNLGAASVTLNRSDLPAFVPVEAASVAASLDARQLGLGGHGFLFARLEN